MNHNPGGPPLNHDQSENSRRRPEFAAGSMDIHLSPPDNKFGWAVVGASFMAHLIADGCCFSFGIIFVELLEIFGESRSKTAWVGSVFVSMPMICGPIASSFTNRFGCRRTTMAGGLVAAVGCFASAFVDSIDMLCVTFGLISGFGLALVFVPAVVIVAFYFEKKRAFATGIAVAGSGIGTFIFAPLAEFLIKKYSWKGAFIITSAILLNIVLCGAFFRPLVMYGPRSRRPLDVDDTSKTTSDMEQSHPPPSTLPPRFVFKAYLENGNCLYYETTTQSLIQFPTYLEKEFHSMGVELMDWKNRSTTLRDVLARRGLLHKFKISEGRAPDDKSKASQATETATSQATEPGTNVRGGENGASNDDKKPNEMRRINSLTNPRWKDSRHAERFRMTSRKDVFYRGSLMRTGFMLTNEYSASCPDLFLNANKRSRETEEQRTLCTVLRRFLHRTFDLSVFKSIIFNYFCLHSFLLFLMYDIPYVYVPDQAVRFGAATEKEAPFLVAIIGISSTVGQITMGYVGDLPNVDTLHLYNATTSFAGIITLFVPLLGKFSLLAVYCSLYGFFISANYALTTIILVDLLGMDRFTNAFGIASFAEGLANLLGPPLAGWLYDVTDSYSSTFYLAGTIIWFSGSMLFAIPCLHRCEKNESEEVLAQGPCSLTSVPAIPHHQLPSQSSHHHTTPDSSPHRQTTVTTPNSSPYHQTIPDSSPPHHQAPIPALVKGKDKVQTGERTLNLQLPSIPK